MDTKKKIQTPFLVMLISTILLLTMVILPYASATDDYRYLLEYPDEDYVEETGMTNKNVVNISLIEYIRLYAEGINQGMDKATCIACIVIISLFALFSLIALILAICKKTVGVIVFDILAMLVFKLIHYDFEDRGVIPSSSYDWAFASFMPYVIGVIIIAAAVWFLIVKKQIKRLEYTDEIIVK